MTKIALICPDGLSVVLFCKGIIKSLNSISGAEVHIICDVGSYREDIESLGAVVVPLDIYRFLNLSKDLKYTQRLWQQFRSQKYDVVFNFSTKPNIYGTIAAKCAGTPTILSHVVGRGSAFEDRSDIKGRILRWVVALLYKLIGSWNQSVWFTNTNDLRYFIEGGLIQEKKTVISRNYLDVHEYSIKEISKDRLDTAQNLCKLKDGEDVVVMVARMIWAKGIREFTDAAIKMRGSHPNLKFVLIAPLEEGSYGAVPEAHVREVERSANFIWLGFQKDVKALYAISDIAVLPSYYKEGGYPRALLEPMAMGKPLITTDTDGCRGAVEDGVNGYLIPAQDADSLANKIARIMNDKVLMEEMGKCSYTKALAEFDEKKIVPDALHRLGLPISI
jgi:N,N'-diacetylbacillosaminyl-diphospho-undecaprenol alpha-1,3-N-acetylgalactosaminyltransferase